MDDDVSKRTKPRWRVQFSLRSLAFVVSIIAIALFYWVSWIPNGIRQTGRELDVAILGRGYVQVTDYASGENYYTRLGRLSIDASGQIYLGDESDRWRPQPEITIPMDWISIKIDKYGSIAHTDGSNVQTFIGNVELARFPNREGLKQVYPDFYAETEQSGPPIVGQPGVDGFGFLRQGWLESSGGSIEIPQLAFVVIILVAAGVLWLEIRSLGRKLDAVIERLPER